MASDPYDSMLLTERPTTVVTQATRLHDTMPDPHGSSQDEESLFSGIGADPLPPAASAQAPGGALARSAAQGVLTGDDAAGAATVRSGAGAAQAVYDALVALPPAERDAWASSRPQMAAAVSEFAKTVGLPVPVKGGIFGLGIGIGTVLAIGGIAYFLLRGRRA